VAWEPFSRLVEARVGPNQTELVNAEMWDPDTGAVLVLWPVPDPAETGIMGPDIRRSEIAAGDWWEAGSERGGGTGHFQEFDYFTEELEDPVRPPSSNALSPPRVVFHRASMGTRMTLCNRDTGPMKPMATEWDPVLEPLVCDQGCSNIEPP